MRSLAELVIWLSWRLLSKRTREALARRILALHARAQIIIPQSRVVVYAFSKATASCFGVERFESPILASKFPRYSLIITCRNEANTMVALLDTVLRQSVLPREVVICDGGSTDGTCEVVEQWNQERLRKLAVSSTELARDELEPQLTVALLREAPLSIAAGRNKAVSQAKCPVLLFTDAGSTLDASWAERLLVAFVQDEDTEVAMGWYRPLTASVLERAAAHFILPQLAAVDPATFLPSGRSLALKNKLFDSVGGYPEHLSHAGEDSMFDYYVKTAAKCVAFVPDAIAYWRFPSSLVRLAKTVFGYARGDAESGLLFWEYYLRLLDAAGRIALELVVLGIVLILSLALGGLFLWLLSAIVGLSISYRLLKLFASYQPLVGVGLGVQEKLARIFALGLMIISQLVGFLCGLNSRAVVEKRRIAKATKGHLVLLLPKFHRFEPESETTKLVLQQLQASWYLTLLYARNIEMPEADKPSFLHPQLENHLRSAFQFDAWWEKHREFIEQPEYEFRYLDYSGDGFAADLLTQLRQVGAVELEL